MTNLSKELCDICGIKPMYRIEGIERLQSRTALNLINLARANTNYKDIDAESVYPNFEKPENFVKLLNLPTETIIKNRQTIPAKNIWWIVNTYVENCKILAPYNFEHFLIFLIVILENKNKIYSDEFVNRIKQAIRKALPSFKRDDRLREQGSVVEVCGLP